MKISTKWTDESADTVPILETRGKQLSVRKTRVDMEYPEIQVKPSKDGAIRRPQ